VHGGPDLALVVRPGDDGSVWLTCRAANLNGNSCSVAKIWESLGFTARQAEPGPTTIAHPEDVVAAVGSPPDLAATEDVVATVGPQPQLAAAEAIVPPVCLPQTTVAANVPALLRRAKTAGGDRSVAGRSDRSYARMLRSLARQMRLVRGLDHRFYAQIPIDGHKEVHELRSAAFEDWLILNYRQRQMPVPGAGRLKSLIRTFEADAAMSGSTEAVWVRVVDGSGRSRAGRQAEALGRRDAPVPSRADAAAVYYLDLGDSSWRSVEISAVGCRIVERAPVLFRRPKGFGELPLPQWDGTLDLLKIGARRSSAAWAGSPDRS